MLNPKDKSEFKKGFFIGAGVVAALMAVGIVTGVIGKVL